MTENIYGFIYHKDQDGIVTITMDMQGPVNAMNQDYRDAMAVLPDKLAGEPGLIGVIFTSAKSTFFAGGDLKEIVSVEKGQEEAQFNLIEQAVKIPLRKLEHLPVPVVAAINGAALGGGLELCLACNHRIIVNHPKAVVGLPEVSLGLLPGGGGVVRTIHMLGLENALSVLLEGKKYRPQQALELGLVDQMVDSLDDLLPAAKAWIKNNADKGAQPWDLKGHKIPGGNIWSPKVNGVLAVAPAMLFKKTRGLLPAPERILAVAGDAMAVDFDTALRVESRGLAHLITTPEVKNLITSGFLQMNKINSGASRPKDVMPASVKKVGILGAGMMGQGIAYSSAAVGIEVILKDISLDNAEKGKAYSARLMDKLIAAGRKTEQDKQELLALIKATDSYQDLAGCDLVIEAVFENIDLKASVTREAQQYLSDTCVIGSNTSTLPISQLAQASAHPQNFIGIHFFSPVDKMPLIEIICGEKTSDATLALAFDYAKQIRKTPIVVNDSLGFFTSRVFGSYLDEGARLLVDGLDPVLIDAMGKQVGMPVGPLTIQDEVSQELSKKAANTHREMGVFCSKGDNSVNAMVCERLIDEYGRGGRYHGGGYYEYHQDGSKQIWPILYELYFKPQAAIANQDIKDRLLFRQIVETLKCLQEHVLRSVADGNIGSLMGIGAPTWTGGFLQAVNTWEYAGESGPKAFAIRCEELSLAYGERFAAPDILRQHAETNQWFL